MCIIYLFNKIKFFHLFKNIKTHDMKKIFLSLLVCGSIFSAFAQVDSTTKTTTTTTTTATPHKYSYYPSSDVYFDQSTGNYWYHDKVSAT